MSQTIPASSMINFYPRSPCGERPVHCVALSALASISIHALLAESDGALEGASEITLHFYPRSPCGERHHVCQSPRVGWIYFYPRSPCGERPGLILFFLCCIIISIHALLAESDANPRRNQHQRKHFYPRSPCGERLAVGR